MLIQIGHGDAPEGDYNSPSLCPSMPELFILMESADSKILVVRARSDFRLT